MSGASIETTLELWVSSLRDVKARIGSLFRQARVAMNGTLVGTKLRLTCVVAVLRSVRAETLEEASCSPASIM